MKATELMLGDWVEFQGGYYQIATLKKSGVIELQHSDGLLVPITTNYIEDCIKPIPPTPEILKLNGWKSVEFPEIAMTKYFIDTEQYSIQIPFYDVTQTVGRLRIAIKNTNSEVEILHILPVPDSVSKLQHLLRACGYDDLADNFKVIEGYNDNNN